MKISITNDIQNALRLLNESLPETEQEIDAFICGVESGAIEIPATPAYLTPSAIANALIQGRRPQPYVTPFSKPQILNGIEGMKLAARNGGGPLSEETIRKIKEAQEEG